MARAVREPEGNGAARAQAAEAALEASAAGALAAKAPRGADDVGLGVDIVEIERMRRILARTPRFAERVFSADERAYCDATMNPAVHYALRFAAKEAVVKALGTGFSAGIGVRDIEVVRTSSGRPAVRLHGKAADAAASAGVRSLPLSLSYTANDAVACAMAITERSAKASDARRDPKAELARRFKEARALLDDM